VWRLLFHNAGWKLGSLGLSILLWFAMVGEPELATIHNVPVLYRNLPKGLLIGSNAIDTVRVELRGPSSRLTNVALSDVAIMLDLSSVDGPGERTFTLSDADIRLPDGVTFLRSIPSQMRMRFARVKYKEVPVELRFGSPLPPGLRIVKQEVTPQTLHISGPENRVDAVVRAESDAIDLSGISQDVEIRVNTFVADPQVWLESSPSVTVRLSIEKQSERQTEKK
jgi:YbbR domain-containing protein